MKGVAGNINVGEMFKRKCVRMVTEVIYYW